jgi:hypothetical protein
LNKNFPNFHVFKSNLKKEINKILISKNKKLGCENWLRESIVIMYARTALFENQVNLEKN